MSESETVLDVVEEMREKAAHFEKNSELMVSENAIALFILPYADRIEAAHKRCEGRRALAILRCASVNKLLEMAEYFRNEGDRELSSACISTANKLLDYVLYLEHTKGGDHAAK